MDNNNRVCPTELAGGLDNRIRRWLQNPQKILGDYIHEGMTVLDVGCGPGYFSVDMARMVGQTGRVIAADLQEGMLQIVRDKVQSTELEKRITLHQCQPERIGVTEKVDFVLLFYMVHEVPDRVKLFTEIADLLKPNGQVLIVEPPLHVSKKAFDETIETARNAGLMPVDRPKVFFGLAMRLQKD
jgi:ubiquinone/menaquinone biosynthesis C-methylase UbiE